MTQFVDTVGPRSDTRYIPSDLVTINGVNLYTVLPGYEQLNTEGRHVVPFNVQSSHVKGQDGASLDEAYIESRLLTVTYRLESTSDIKQREDMALLNAALTKKNAILKFADDGGFSFIHCYLSDSTITHEFNNMVIGTFSFRTLSPYAKKQMTSTGSVALLYADKVRPKRITFTASAPINGESFNIKNMKGEKISFNQLTMKTGETLTIEYSTNPNRVHIAWSNGSSTVSAMDKLARYMEVTRFYLYKTDNITLSSAMGSLKIDWEDEKL